MAFEPLETDEKLEAPVPRERDTDTVMLIGCSGFVGAALITYGLSIWPFFIFREVHLMAELGRACLAGLVPTAIFGAYVTRRFGLASACGFVGGGLTSAVFLFLRLTTEVEARRHARDMEPPDYPSSWVWIVPAVWVILSFTIAALFLKRSEIDVSGSGEQDANP